ncbi:hypothetical protein ANN_28916 [Periplaneta americana]|uniref:Uncharacterized protein n=1 Tax=Periplaneta americana TaxID=6978 RepID=A0ABQ8S9G3_PERAM|nr:hypothetical protein ANN_28916 [Periplaneta americana]
MDLREVGYDDRDWINLAQDRDCWGLCEGGSEPGSLKPFVNSEQDYDSDGVNEDVNQPNGDSLNFYGTCAKNEETREKSKRKCCILCPRSKRRRQTSTVLVVTVQFARPVYQLHVESVEKKKIQFDSKGACNVGISKKPSPKMEQMAQHDPRISYMYQCAVRPLSMKPNSVLAIKLIPTYTITEPPRENNLGKNAGGNLSYRVKIPLLTLGSLLIQRSQQPPWAPENPASQLLPPVLPELPYYWGFFMIFGGPVHLSKCSQPPLGIFQLILGQSTKLVAAL